MIKFVELINMLYFLFELNTAILVILDFLFHFGFFAKVKVLALYLIFNLMIEVNQPIFIDVEVNQPISVDVEVTLCSLQLFKDSPLSTLTSIFILKAICILHLLVLGEKLFIIIFCYSLSKHQDLVRG